MIIYVFKRGKEGNTVREIGINLHVRPDLCAVEFIKQAKKFGFNTVFTNVPDERGLHIIASTLAANGMRYESINAPDRKSVV